MTPYQRLLLLLKPDNREIGQVYTIALFKGLIALSLPLGIQSIINFIQGGNVSASWVVLSFLISGAVAFNGYLQLMQMSLMEKIQQKIFARAAFDFTIRLPKIDLLTLSKYYPPELMNRFFEIMIIQKALPKIIIDLSTALLQIFFGLLLLSFYHSFFIYFSILLGMLIFVVIRYTGKKAMESSLAESKYKYQVVGWLEEYARSRESFRLAGTSVMAVQNTDNRVTGYLNARETHFNVLRTQYKLLLVFKVLISLSLLIIGGLLVINQKMNIGQFVAAEIIILLVMDSVEKIILNLENVYDLFTSVEKLSLITDMPLEQYESDRNNSVILEKKPLELDLKDINFAFDTNKPSLYNSLNYSFLPGGKYCITGTGGSGKSTLLHIMSGQIQPQSGNVCINGVPIKNYDISGLYKHFGNALKEESIFEGSIIDNITLGRSGISQDDVAQALKTVKAWDEIQSLTKGWLTGMSPLGKQFPSSFIQKILIARCIVHKPSLILFEQTMDAIAATEAEQIIAHLCANPQWTLIVVSKNELFQKYCDIMLELKNGKLIANN